jgi:hypothetical protein
VGDSLGGKSRLLYERFQNKNKMAIKNSTSLYFNGICIRIYKTIILPEVLCGCEIWSLTLGEEHRLRVFANKVLSKLFGLKRNEVTVGGENCIIRGFMTCALLQV